MITSGEFSTITKSESETRAVAKQLSKTLTPGDIVLLIGDLGAGKTAFVKGFVEGLGLSDDVVSPTFTILNIYGEGVVNHYDLYRLDSSVEFENTGAHESLYLGGISLIEWPERVGLDYFPESAWRVEIQKISDSERKIIVTRNI